MTVAENACCGWRGRVLGVSIACVTKMTPWLKPNPPAVLRSRDSPVGGAVCRREAEPAIGVASGCDVMVQVMDCCLPTTSTADGGGPDTS